MLPFIVVNLLGLLAGICACMLAFRGRRWAFALSAMVLAALVGKSLLTWKPAWEAALFPWPDYIYLQGYWIYAIGLVFFGLAIPQLPLVWNRWVVAMVAVLVSFWGLQSTWWMVSPERHGRDKGADALHHCRQTTHFTCAPSSCVCALSHLGIATTEREMAELCLTRASGTTRFNTYRGLMLKLAGTAWKPRMTETPVETLLTPGLVAVIDFPEEYHAISTIGNGDGVLLHDPLMSKPYRMTRDQLAELYGGLAIILEPR
jgi:hypothetical protein